ELLAVGSIDTTCAASSLFDSAGIVTVAAWPALIFVASLSAKAAVASLAETPTRSTNDVLPELELLESLDEDDADASTALVPAADICWPTTPSTLDTVPPTGARSTVWSSARSASASAACACKTDASACARAATVGGACLIWLPSFVDFAERRADETCCRAVATCCCADCTPCVSFSFADACCSCAFAIDCLSATIFPS